jgi:DNA repair exonuclease SbcCD ATPase subunit
MSLMLLRVELINIRSHEHFIFEPEPVGITAIQGANGTGKSSTVDSIAWTLFGTKPDGVSKSVEIFRNGIGEKDKALARVDFLIDGTRIRFERRRVNKQGTLECEVWSVGEENGEEKLTQLAGPAISHAEPYIRKLLRMDEKGFLASILVQQKQVDQLISANPRERGAVIEKLTGIAGVTAALVESRQDFNSLKKAASFSSIDEAGLAKLRLEESSVKAEAVEIHEHIGLIKTQASELKASGEAFKNQLSEATAKYERKIEIERRIADLQTRIGIKTETLEETTRAKEVERKALTGASSGAYDELNSQIRELDAKRDKLNIKMSRAQDALDSLNKEKAELEEELETIGALPELSEETLREEHEALVNAQELLRTDIIEAKNQKAQIQSAISVIEHGDSCPTCLQTVAEPQTAVKALELTIAGLDKSRADNQVKLDENKLELASLESQLQSILTHSKSAVRLVEIKERTDLAKKALDSAGSDLRVLNKELKSLNELFDEAKKSKERQKAYKNLLDRAQALTEQIEEFEFELTKLKTEDQNLDSASQRSLNALQKKLDDVRTKHSSVSLDYTKSSGDLKMKRQKIEFLLAEIARHQADIEKHQELLKSVAVASHTVDLVSEFREERIRNSIPVIEVYASDLLSRFTDGKFNRLTLDQKFNATVYLADGTARSVGLLSGGELSAAAMSLRLAISMLLNSGADQNVVILDEVLVSQDGARAEQILATIKEMFQGQVVLIAHNESIDAIADKIVTLSSN